MWGAHHVAGRLARMDWITVDQIAASQREDLLALYRSAWWATNRSAADVDEMLDGSDLVVGLVDSDTNRLLGFCRAITDGRFVALILDVITHPDIRGSGGGRVVMEAMLSRPELARVDSIELVCQPDLVDFYRQFGFTDQAGGSRLMRRTDNPQLSS